MESNVVWTSTFIEKYYHVVQKQERHTGLDEYEGMQIMTIKNFFVNYPFKRFRSMPGSCWCLQISNDDTNAYW